MSVSLCITYMQKLVKVIRKYGFLELLCGYVELLCGKPNRGSTSEQQTVLTAEPSPHLQGWICLFLIFNHRNYMYTYM